MELNQPGKSKKSKLNLCSQLEDQNTQVFNEKIRFFCLKNGNFRLFFVSYLIVITLKPAPVVLPRKIEAEGKGFIS